MSACIQPYVWMSQQSRSVFQLLHAQMSLILFFCLSLTGIQSKPRKFPSRKFHVVKHLYGHANTNTQIHAHNKSMTGICQALWRLSASYFSFKVNVLRADEPASVCRPDLGRLGLWTRPWNHLIQISHCRVCLFPFFCSQIFKKKMCLRKVVFIYLFFFLMLS